MPLLSKPSAEAKIALLFVTVGSLIIVWSVVWLLFQQTHGAQDWEQYTCYGSLGSGLVLLVIGLAVGRIARAARQAELPPAEVTPAENQISQNANSRAPIVTPTGLGGVAVTGANPAATEAVNPAAPVARVVPANSAIPPRVANGTANTNPAPMT
jgi:hypothetical protein